MHDDNLAYFQAELLTLLASGKSPEEIKRQLLADERLQSFADYIQSFEPPMIDVAVALVKKWGRRGKP